VIYISKKAALAGGLTHEGTLFGVPAWFAGDDDGEICMATPKFVPFHAWCWLADKAYGIASYFMSSDSVLVSPIDVIRKIAP
jgi:hypothetical protein